MPFREQMNEFYNEHIVDCINSLGFEVKRGDDFFGSRSVIEDVWQLINESVFIIADLTGKNANVFYEIGIAHTLGKEVILIAQSKEDIPFDLRYLRHFYYNLSSEDSINKFRSDLEMAIKETNERIAYPRLITDSILGEDSIYQYTESLKYGETRFAFEQHTNSLLIFLKEKNDKIEILKQIKYWKTSLKYLKEQNVIVVSVSAGGVTVNAGMVVDVELVDNLKEVIRGNARFYFIIVDDIKHTISSRVIYYDEFSRKILNVEIERIQNKSSGKIN